jgi:hypothetical protein
MVHTNPFEIMAPLLLLDCIQDTNVNHHGSNAVEVLVFANPNDPAKERFFHAISKVPRFSPKFVLEHERFLSILKKNTIDWRVIVFFAYEQDDLVLATSLRQYLIDTRVIMVLSEWNGETVKMGLSISPSLITNANDDFSDVIAVLEKISTIAQ